jgi:co-chaperonin GroES (HSP10)
MSLKDLKAINDKIIFVFLQDIEGGMFRERTLSGIEIIERAEKQIDKARWGKVIKVGKSVTEISVGQYILVDKLQWTTHLLYKDEKFWMTDEKSVLAVSDLEPKV